MRANKNVYNEYTLEKIKNFIIKNVDKIKLIGGDMHLYFPNKEKFKILRQNESIIQYVLNDTNNFKTLEEYILNKNLIKRIEIKSSPCGECSADAFELIFKIILKSGNISKYYHYDKETLKLLKKLSKDFDKEHVLKYGLFLLQLLFIFYNSGLYIPYSILFIYNFLFMEGNL